MVKLPQILIGLLLCFPIYVQAQDDVIRVDTNLVSIPVSVTDRDGRFVSGLKRENFRILENSIEQELLFFAEAPRKAILEMQRKVRL